MQLLLQLALLLRQQSALRQVQPQFVAALTSPSLLMVQMAVALLLMFGRKMEPQLEPILQHTVVLLWPITMLITCVFTSNAGCVSTNNITSNSITITVNTSSTPSVSISAANTTICAGTAITFTAAPINGGTSPTYQWYKNNSPIPGATSVSYSTAYSSK
jgi:hypothetical protein